MSGQLLKWDDWLMGMGLLISMEPAICEYLCKSSALILSEKTFS
jgi:hypothetical protein